MSSNRNINLNYIAFIVLITLILILVVFPPLGQAVRDFAVSIVNVRVVNALDTIASVFGVAAGSVWLWNLLAHWTGLPSLKFLTSKPTTQAQVTGGGEISDNSSDELQEFIVETQELARNLYKFWNDRNKRMPESRYGMGLSKEEEEKDQLLFNSWVDETSAQYSEQFLEQVLRARRIFKEHGIENVELEKHYSKAKDSESVRILAEELFNMCTDLERRKNLRLPRL